MLARIRKSIEEKDKGFTLIELLVVVVIIGILAAIAIPTFLNQRKKAWEKAVVSDLRNAAVVNEDYFSDKGLYAPDAAALDTAPYTLQTSDDVTLVIPAPGTATGYCMQATHSSLTAVTDVWVLNSSDGKVKKLAAGC